MISLTLEVPQLNAARLAYGQLYSARHVTCYNVIMTPGEGKEALMAHVHEKNGHIFSPQQLQEISDFRARHDSLIAQIILGSDSIDPVRACAQLKAWNIHCLPTLKVITSGMNWSANYTVEEGRLQIRNEHGALLYDGAPFLEYSNAMGAYGYSPERANYAAAL